MTSVMSTQNNDFEPQNVLFWATDSGIFIPFQNGDPGPMILGKIICISVKLGKWIQNRTGDFMHISIIWC